MHICRSEAEADVCHAGPPAGLTCADEVEAIRRNDKKGWPHFDRPAPAFVDARSYLPFSTRINSVVSSNPLAS